MAASAPPPASSWHPTGAAGPVSASISLPGSKSLTNRFLVLAAIASDTSRLRGPLHSRDTTLMSQALRQLGADITERPSDVAPDAPHPAALTQVSASPHADWLITPHPLRGAGTIDCGLAGTVMRFLPPLAAVAQGSTTFDGDPAARRRPIAPVINAIRALGGDIDATTSLPFTVRGTGRLRGGEVTLDASASSQFVSALLLAGATYEQGITVRHEGPPLPSEPHVTMTIEALRDAGAVVDDTETLTWRVEPSDISGLDVDIEPDLSNAAPFLAAALVTGGTIHIPGWPQHTTQAGDALRDILDAMGADVRLAREGLTVTGTGSIHGVDLDLHDASELTPVIATLAALADSPTIIHGVGHIRGHETDRITALATELTGIGATVAELDDGLAISPGAPRAHSWHTYEDHRMVMAGAVAALAIPQITLDDPGTVAKTLPEFVDLWERMIHTSTR